MRENEKKIVLYGIGLEGEKFFWKWKNKYDIVYCLDKKKQNSFHGLSVYSLEEKKAELKEHMIIVTPGGVFIMK